MATLNRNMHVAKPRQDVLASVLSDLGSAFQSQGYTVQAHGPDGVTFVRKRTLGRGLIALLESEQSIAVSLSDEDSGTRITIVGQGPRRLRRAIDEL
jgi:hypothetical protein